jgi:hypothetical protein
MAILRRFNEVLTEKGMNTPYGKYCPDTSCIGLYDGRIIAEDF